jgi:hypothetical protein
MLDQRCAHQDTQAHEKRADGVRHESYRAILHEDHLFLRLEAIWRF